MKIYLKLQHYPSICLLSSL